MASSSSSPTNSMYANVITECLTKNNHVTGKAQVLAVLHDARLEGHVSGAVQVPPKEVDGKEKDTKVPNPAYDEWYAADQQVLGFLLSSLSKEILPQVAMKETVAAAWKEIANTSSYCHNSSSTHNHLEGQHVSCRVHEQDAISS
jgi:hypothetical protein